MAAEAEADVTVEPAVNIFDLTYGQRVSIVVIKVIVGTLSTIGSALLIYNAVRKLQLGQNRIYHRLLLGMSILDIFHSFFGGTLVNYFVPPESGSWGAMGTTATCTFQGFAIQMSVAVPLYNASLSMFFFLMIQFDKSKHRAHVDKIMCYIEPIFHIVPWAVGLATSCVALTRNLYNALNVPEAGCWIEHYPLGCGYTVGSPDDDQVPRLECTRGTDDPHELLYLKWALFFWPLSVACALVFIFNIAIFWSVWAQEQKVQRHGIGNQERMKKSLRAVAVQNLLYCLVMLNTVLWLILSDVAVTEGYFTEDAVYPLHLLYLFTYPSQGIGNFLVYIRRRYLRLRREESLSRCLSFYKASLPDEPTMQRRSSRLSFTNVGGGESMPFAERLRRRSSNFRFSSSSIRFGSRPSGAESNTALAAAQVAAELAAEDDDSSVGSVAENVEQQRGPAEGESGHRRSAGRLRFVGEVNRSVEEADEDHIAGDGINQDLERSKSPG